MKQYYTLCIFLAVLCAGLPSGSHAQSHRNCGTNDVAKLFASDFTEKQRALSEKAYVNWINIKQSAKSSHGVRWIIPVVVHVLHRPADVLIGDTSNISDQRIIDEIRIMNEDFRKMAGTRGDGPGTDMQIEFQLASKDPQGACTNGIIRMPYANSQNHDSHTASEVLNLKGTSHWPSDKYLNMYVIHSIANGVFGYATFPWNTGTPALDSIDGVVIAHYAFGLSGDGLVGYGRTATHETGHWLGLLHTFENGCKNDTCLVNGDKVCDTPPIGNPTLLTFPCISVANNCSTDDDDTTAANPFRPVAMGGLGNQPDMHQNYMDYSNDSCMDRFTPGQYVRAQFYLNDKRATLISNNNALTAGVKRMLIDFDSLGTTIGLNAKVTAMTEWREKGLLIIAGDFTDAGGLTVPKIVAWDGQVFSTLAGAPAFNNSAIKSLAVYKGSLYVGGDFDFAGLYKNLVKFDGATWSKVTSSSVTDRTSTGSPVRAMLVYQGKLYVGGDFGVVNGNTLSANRIAAWDGSAWSILGTGPSNGLSGNSAACYAMTTWNNRLIVGGRFTSATGIICDKVASWNGSTFSSLNSGTAAISAGSLNCLGSFQGKLFAGGDFYGAGGIVATGLLGYDSTTWTATGANVGFNRFTMEVFNGMLWVGGEISSLGTYVSNAYAYDNTLDSFYTIAADYDGFENPVTVMTTFRDELYIAGEFTTLRGKLGTPGKNFGYITKARTYCEDPILGTRDVQADAAKVLIYPNPASNEVVIKNASGTFSVYNTLGVQCGAGDITSNVPYRFSVASYAPGIYYFRFKDKCARVIKL